MKPQIHVRSLKDLKKYIKARALLAGTRAQLPSTHLWVSEKFHETACAYLKKRNYCHYVNGSFGDGKRGIHLTDNGSHWR
jgi:hypothetical protein